MSPDTLLANLVSHKDPETFDQIIRLVKELALLQKKFLDTINKGLLEKDIPNPHSMYATIETKEYPVHFVASSALLATGPPSSSWESTASLNISMIKKDNKFILDVDCEKLERDLLMMYFAYRPSLSVDFKPGGFFRNEFKLMNNEPPNAKAINADLKVFQQEEGKDLLSQVPSFRELYFAVSNTVIDKHLLPPEHKNNFFDGYFSKVTETDMRKVMSYLRLILNMAMEVQQNEKAATKENPLEEKDTMKFLSERTLGEFLEIRGNDTKLDVHTKNLVNLHEIEFRQLLPLCSYFEEKVIDQEYLYPTQGEDLNVPLSDEIRQHLVEKCQIDLTGKPEFTLKYIENLLKLLRHIAEVLLSKDVKKTMNKKPKDSIIERYAKYFEENCKITCNHFILTFF